MKENLEWHKLRRKLNKDNHNYSDSWNLAIGILENRLTHKYLTPIENLLKNDTKKGEGFPIVALCCSLIETLAAFKEGKIYNHRYSEENDPNYQYKDSITFFCEFLQNTHPFSTFFETDDFKSLDFYSNVRSALIHECRTRSNWIINTQISPSSKIIFEKKKHNKIIYRTTLFNEIKITYLPNYFSDLRNPANNELRKKLGRKMDNLYEYNRNQDFPWWLED